MHIPALPVLTPTASSRPAFERAQALNRELHEELSTIQATLVAELGGAAPPPLPAHIVTSLLDRYAELSVLDELLDADQRALVRMQHKILVQPLFLSVPLIRRSVDRPLGYPGDYLMVEMIFGGGPVPDGLLASWLGEVVQQSAPSRAHRYRAPWAHAWLDVLSSQQTRPLRILSFACGPELVLRSYFRPQSSAHVVLCDHEPRALVHAEAGLAPLLNETSTLRCVQLSAVNLLRGGARDALLPEPSAEGFDAVLVLGLFDYLRSGLVQRLTRAFHALLRPGGLLLASNLSVANPHRSLMEYVADWQVIHRAEQDFAQVMLTGTGFELVQLISDPSAANLLFVGRVRES